MGVGRRILDLARANLNALLDRAARTELDGLSEAELTDELERRKREREAQEGERQQRIQAEDAAKQRAQARGKTPPPRSPKPRSAARRQSEAEQKRARALELYRTLGVRADAPMDEVKHAYRALMREHHPDKHAGDPVKQKAASARAATITTAYAELETLIGKPRR